MVSRARSRCQIALSLLVLAVPALGQTYLAWNGLGTNGNWTNAGNWQGAAAPANDGSASVQFGVSDRTLVTVDAAQDIAGLKFDYPATNDLRYRINGSTTTLTLGSGGLVTTNAAPAGPPPALGSVNSATPGTVTFQGALGLGLSANQTWTLASGTAVLAGGNVSGPGSLTLAGSGYVSLSGNNTYAGGTDLAGGALALGSNTALGTGPLTVSGPAAIYSDASSRSLVNSLLLNASSLLIEAYAGEVRFTGPVTLGASTTLTNRDVLTVFDGAVGEAGGSRSLTLTGAGGLVIAGNSTYSGGTEVLSSALFFRQAGSVPAVGSLSADALAYVGAGFTTGIATGFIARFSPANTAGTIGFDTDPAAISANVIAEPINLAAFSSLARLGSATRATLSAGATITPAPAGGYRFGGGGGTLRVESRLTGSGTTVTADSSRGTELSVYLTFNDTILGGNDYTGQTSATRSAIIFGAGSAPAGVYALGTGGYIGTQDLALLPSAWINRFAGTSVTGVIGWDTANVASPHVVGGATEPIDLSRFTTTGAAIALGTTSAARLAGAITLPPGQTDYHFAGYKGGWLTVDSTLSGARGVRIADALGDYPEFDRNDPTRQASVFLTAANSHTGGTILYGGRLVLDHVSALGSGSLTVSPSPYNDITRVETSLTSAPTFGNALVVRSGFEAGGPNSFGWSGDIADSGAGTGRITKHGPSSLTLSGNNTGFSGGFRVGEGTITFASNTAAGSGELDFGSIGTVTAAFTSTAPTVGGLGEGTTGARLTLAGGTTLTINQASGATFLGQIQGSGGLVKSGTAPLTLAAASSFTGGTRITAGSLEAAATGALGTGQVTLDGPTSELSVASGAIVANPVIFGAGGGLLSGNGSFAHGVTVGANSGIAPGNSVGALTFTAGLTLAANGYYEVEVQNASGGPGLGWDTTQVTGTLNFTAALGSPFTIFLRSLDGSGTAGNALNFDPYTAYSWTILSATTLTGFSTAAVTFDTSGFLSPVNGGTFSLATSGNSLAVNFTPVPEPETWALMAIGLVAAAWTRVRRRRD